jgi:hypothetical protein
LVDLLATVDSGMADVSRTLPAIGDGSATLPALGSRECPDLEEELGEDAPGDIQVLYARWARARDEFCDAAAHLHQLRRAHAVDTHPTDHRYRSELDHGIRDLRRTRTTLALLAQQLRHRVAREIDGSAGGMVCPNCGARDPFPPTKSDNATTTCPACGHRFPVDDQPGGRKLREPTLVAAELSHPGG